MGRRNVHEKKHYVIFRKVSFPSSKSLFYFSSYYDLNFGLNYGGDVDAP